MANRAFRKQVQKRMTTGGINWATADIRAILVDTATDDPDTGIAGDEFLADIAAGARVDVTLTLQNVTVVDGVVDADDLALPDTGGATGEEIVMYAHTGNEATAALLLCFDTATGLPISRDSVADTIQWAAGGIYVGG